MSSPSRRARRNAKVREEKDLIDGQEAGYQGNKSKEHENANSSIASSLNNASPAASQPKADHSKNHAKRSRDIVRPLISVTRLASTILCFLDHHNGSVTAIATVAIVVLTYFYVGYSKEQWKAMRESNNINRDALISVQRAFVSFGELPEIRSALDKTNTHVVTWSLRMTLQNGGTTPAVNARQWTGKFSSGRSPMPANFQFPTSSDKDPFPPDPYILGPKTSASGSDIHFNPIELMPIPWLPNHIYIYGWVTYNDVFPNTPLHVTMFCHQISAVGDTTLPLHSPGGMEIGFGSCRRHNCADDQCNGEPGDPRTK